MIFKSDKTYKILKWLGITVFPAILTFAGVVFSTVGYIHTDAVMTIGAAFVTLWNTVLGISSEQYQREAQDEIRN